MIQKLVALLTSFIVFLGTFSTAMLPKVPDPPAQQELSRMSTFLKPAELAETIYYVNARNLPADEKNMLMCLQGIVAKTNPAIFLVLHGYDGNYHTELVKTGKTVLDTGEAGNAWTTQSLLKKFKAQIGDSGYCLYRETELGYGLNTAANYAALYGWLPVSERLAPLAESCGLVKKADLCAESDNMSLQEKFFNEHKDEFSKDAVVHMKNDRPALRDLAIQQKFFCFYTLDDSAGLKLLKKVLTYTGCNTAVLGWVAEEKRCVAEISSCGCWLNPTDICANNSILAFFDNDNCVQQSSKGTPATDETKHYICFLYSDGDNCQWIQNGYGEYRSIRSNSPDIPMSWTFSPFMKDFCPSMYNYVVSAANSDNQLIGGPSGLGYCTLSRFPAEALDKYSALSAAAMQRSGQRIMASLDDYTSFKDSRMQYALSYFSRFDNIDGGLLFIDPSRYEGGRGKIWFCDDKPFVSVRLSLWLDGGYKKVTEQWIKEQADIVNSYPVDIHSVDGYSLICVHAWTIETDWIQPFLDNLDDDVVVLNASDFIATITANVPHKNAVPSTSDQSPILR